MFYKTQLKDHIRVAPKYFGNDVNDAVIKAVREKYAGYIDEDIGFVIDVLDIQQVGEGVIIPGDGAAYYETTFELITFKPEMHEIIPGKIKDIADFGAFITMGPIDGMIHISQTMDDFVSFAKDKVLSGKDSKRALKVGDECRARVIAVSFKDPVNPKIGLTMRQAGLGKLEWIEAENKQPVKTEEKKEEKADKKEDKKAKK
jgi:DNA-directed RNA polymerase subunit E'